MTKIKQSDKCLAYWIECEGFHGSNIKSTLVSLLGKEHDTLLLYAFTQ